MSSQVESTEQISGNMFAGVDMDIRPSEQELNVK